MLKISYLVSGIANRLGPRILGKHPDNTWLSFNWSNITQLKTFMRRAGDLIPNDDSTIADIGAGQLPYFKFVADKTRRYIAVDTNEILADTYADKRIERRVGTAESLPIEDSVADVVLMNQVLEHVTCPDRTFSEVVRVLKTDGLFIGSVPHLSPVHLEPNDFRRYTDLGVRQLLEKHNFKVIEINASGGVYSSVALLISMDWVLSKRREDQPQEFSQTRAFWLSPIIGIINILGYLGDRFLPESGRTPANLTWIAINKN